MLSGNVDKTILDLNYINDLIKITENYEEHFDDSHKKHMPKIKYERYIEIAMHILKKMHNDDIELNAVMDYAVSMLKSYCLHFEGYNYPIATLGALIEFITKYLSEKMDVDTNAYNLLKDVFCRALEQLLQVHNELVQEAIDNEKEPLEIKSESKPKPVETDLIVSQPLPKSSNQYGHFFEKNKLLNELASSDPVAGVVVSGACLNVHTAEMVYEKYKAYQEKAYQAPHATYFGKTDSLGKLDLPSLDEKNEPKRNQFGSK